MNRNIDARDLARALDPASLASEKEQEPKDPGGDEKEHWCPLSRDICVEGMVSGKKCAFWGTRWALSKQTMKYEKQYDACLIALFMEEPRRLFS